MGQDLLQSSLIKFPLPSPWILYPGSEKIAEAFEMSRICGIGRAPGRFLLVEGPRQSSLISKVESSNSRTILDL